MEKDSNMKVWELISILRDEKHLSDKLIHHLNELYDVGICNVDELLDGKFRNILDKEITPLVSRNILSNSKKVYYYYHELQTLRKNKLSDTGYTLLTVIEVFDKFGGSSIEEIEEFGSIMIPTGSSPPTGLSQE